MYISAAHIDVKKHQDYADFSVELNHKVIVICDGIGEFERSREIAEFTVNQFIEKNYRSLNEFIYDSELQEIKNTGLKAGTTFIKALISNNSDKVKIEYLGDGGIIHLPGDFYNLPNSDFPYKYNEIMLPHNSPNGELNRHLSHKSTKENLKSGELELKLNHPAGDILLLFSDGISSLEERVILRDDHGRYWRNEPETIQFILNELGQLLNSPTNMEEFQEILPKFNTSLLKKLKQNNMLEDDASLGIIITEEVLENFKSSRND